MAGLKLDGLPMPQPGTTSSTRTGLILFPLPGSPSTTHAVTVPPIVHASCPSPPPFSRLTSYCFRSLSISFSVVLMMALSLSTSAICVKSVRAQERLV